MITISFLSLTCCRRKRKVAIYMNKYFTHWTWLRRIILDCSLQMQIMSNIGWIPQNWLKSRWKLDHHIHCTWKWSFIHLNRIHYEKSSPSTSSFCNWSRTLLLEGWRSPIRLRLSFVRWRCNVRHFVCLFYYLYQVLMAYLLQY